MTGGIGTPITLATGGFSRAELRSEVARVFGYYEGTVDSGDENTLVDARLARYPDDYWIGANVWISGAGGAAPEDEDTYVSDSIRSSTALELAPALTVGLSSGDTYQMYLVVNKAEIDKALQSACAGGQAIYTLNESATTLDYDLTYLLGLSDARQITGVWVRSQGDTLVMPQRLDGWQTTVNWGQCTLHLPRTFVDGDQVWVSYTLDATAFTDDGLRCNLPLNLVRSRAVCRLMENTLVQQSMGGVDKYGQLLRYWNEQRQAEERSYQRPVGRVNRFRFVAALEAADRIDTALNIESKYG